MTDPTASIVIPTYNRVSLLPRAVHSVVAQTFEDWEIVVVDDGSTDDTPTMARCLRAKIGPRFVYLRQQNGGSSDARNRGIEAARGRFVAFLDSDDEFMPTKLQRQLALFEARPELGLVYSDLSQVDTEGLVTPSTFDRNCPMARSMACRPIADGLFVCTGDLFTTLLREYFIPTIVGMVRREVLGDSIRFAVDQAYAEEWLFYLHVAKRCRAGFVDEPLSVHHHVQGSLARTDKRRNVERYSRLLQAIEVTFEDLSPEQRGILRGHLIQSHRQLGFDARHEGRHGDAVRQFWHSLAHARDLRGIRELARASEGWLMAGGLTRLAGTKPGAAQDASEPVR